MKIDEFKELLTDFDSLLLGLWKYFHYSPKKDGVFETLQQTYGKKPKKNIKSMRDQMAGTWNGVQTSAGTK